MPLARYSRQTADHVGDPGVDTYVGAPQCRVPKTSFSVSPRRYNENGAPGAKPPAGRVPKARCFETGLF